GTPSKTDLSGRTPGVPEKAQHGIRRTIYLGLNRPPLSRPYGTNVFVKLPYPAINRWAILERPSGTKTVRSPLWPSKPAHTAESADCIADCIACETCANQLS